MCNIRVNKITVNVNKKYDEVKISLYRTNELLGVLTENDLDLPPFSTSGVSLKAYQSYCKDYIIELMDKGVLPGYYYEPKSEVQNVKYDTGTFKKGISEYIADILNNKYEYKVLMTERIDTVEKYKDGYVKDATGEFDVRLLQYDIDFVVIGEIKSGQLCRPRVFRYNDTEYNFNITNVNRIVKML